MNEQDQKTPVTPQEQIHETPSLYVESYLKISDPETQTIIVNMRA